MRNDRDAMRVFVAVDCTERGQLECRTDVDALTAKNEGTGVEQYRAFSLMRELGLGYVCVCGETLSVCVRV